MAQAPGSSSTQAVLMITYTSTQPAGTLIGLTDAKGGLTAAFSPAKAYQSVIICTPTLSQGERYTLYSGGTCSGGDISGYAASGTLSGSAELSTVTLSGVVTSVRSDGLRTGKSRSPHSCRMKAGSPETWFTQSCKSRRKANPRRL